MGGIITSASELVTTAPDRLTICLTSKRAHEINEDLEWLRARILLGSLYRKYGTYLVEVSEIGRYA